MTRFGALLRLDARLLLSRPLFRAFAVASVGSAAAAAGPWFGEPSAHAGFARAMQTLAPLGGALAAVLAAVSLPGDAAEGGLRAVLMRPVSRSATLASRALITGAAVLAVHAVALLVAAAAARLAGPYAAVTHGVGVDATELVSAADMSAAAFAAAPALLWSALGTAWFALAIGAFFDDAAAAAAVALLGALLPHLGSLLDLHPPSWTFAAAACDAAAALDKLAEGVRTDEGILRSAAFARRAVAAPLAWGATALAAAAVRFHARDFRG